MNKFICQICGYIYDETVEKVKFNDLPPEWTCPLCRAPKDMFKNVEETTTEQVTESERVDTKQRPMDELREMTNGELAAVFSNLARGCEKQYKEEASKLYVELASYYTKKTEVPDQEDFTSLLEKINNNLADELKVAKNDAQNASDRGALRALTWSEKVSKITASILDRYEKEGNRMLEKTKVWVCDICGFIYIGDVPPSICPVCKVPNFKIMEVTRI